jgi:hypothetical protein
VTKVDDSSDSGDEEIERLDRELAMLEAGEDSDSDPVDTLSTPRDEGKGRLS